MKSRLGERASLSTGQLFHMIVLTHLYIRITCEHLHPHPHSHPHHHHHGYDLYDEENLVEPRVIRSYRSESVISNISSSPFLPTLSVPASSSSFTTPPNLNEMNEEQSTTTSASVNARKSKWNFTQVNLANKHLFYIRTQFGCSQPRPKLVKVLDYHASPSKQYVPRSTALHRCDDEGGCCEDVTQRCEPSKTEMVELYFHVIRSDVRNDITGGNAVGIERLRFVNHTRCECRPINYMPRTILSSPSSSSSSSLPIYNTSKRKSKLNSTKAEPNAYHKCRHVIKCPEPFVYRFRESDHRCVCDCHGFSKQDGGKRLVETHRLCLHIQKGESQLDPFAARCVRLGECAEPVCGVHWMQYSHDAHSCTPHHRLRHGHRRAHMPRLHHHLSSS